MTTHTFTMSERQAENIHARVSSHMQALKNWTASAVERGDLTAAQELVDQLREHEAIFAAFNMPAKHDIARFGGKPLETIHQVADRRR